MSTARCPKAVLSTPGMIGVMENTATRLVAPYLDDGAATVGFEVCIKHVAAVLEGGSCVCRARLEEIVDGRKLRFAVEVLSVDGRTVGVGTHERRIHRWQAFLTACGFARSGRATASRTSPRSSPTADKVRLIELLGATGLQRLEVTSFVRPDVIPQLADAERGAVGGVAA